jgi:hypothetical protein
MMTGVTAVAAAALVAAPGGLAAASAPKLTNQGYPHVMPVVKPISSTRGGNSGASAGVLPAQSTLGSTKTSRTLPFTGAQLWLFALVGLALIGGGALLKTTARSRSRA